MKENYINKLNCKEIEYRIVHSSNPLEPNRFEVIYKKNGKSRWRKIGILWGFVPISCINKKAAMELAERHYYNHFKEDILSAPEPEPLNKE